MTIVCLCIAIWILADQTWPVDSHVIQYSPVDVIFAAIQLNFKTPPRQSTYMRQPDDKL